MNTDRNELIADEKVLGLYLQDGLLYLVHRHWARKGVLVADVMSTLERRPEYGPKEDNGK